jgi:oligoribonuclease NrnB/cAMP/cGMP phosphodiesterase (DHH superfamily)
MERSLRDPVEREPSFYEKIVTHNDFDGLISAALCAWALKVDRIRFAGPLTIIKSQMTITEKDVVCDLPYPLECGLWFDHHEGNLQELELRKIDPASIPGRFDLKPSCSRVVYEYFSERIELPSYFSKAVEEADVIDSFLMRHWRNGGKRLLERWST